MALLHFFKPVDGLSNPKGSLSISLPSLAIASANREVLELSTSEVGKKRGPYRKYSPEERFEIGQYTNNHGITAAARYFSRRFQRKVRESTVQYIKKDYITNLRQKRVASPDDDDEGDQSFLRHKKHGRPVLIGQELDTKVLAYLKKVRSGGGAVSAQIAMAAARGSCYPVTNQCWKNMEGVRLNRHWAHSLLKHMDFVQRRATTAKSKHSIADFSALKKSFLRDVVATVTMEEIPAGTRLESNWSHHHLGQWRSEVPRGWKWLVSVINGRLRLFFAAPY